MEQRIFKTKEEVAHSLAACLRDWTADGEFHHIALSGGSTPALWFDILSRDYREDLPWDSLEFYWGDERCVAPDHPESNYGMTSERLLKPLGIDEQQVHRMRGEDPPAQEAERYTSLLRQKLPLVEGIPQFDLVILGLGTDGHTASIFPHEMELWDADSDCVVATHPDSGQQRISLSGRVINNAKKVVFLVTGESKADRVDEILNQHAVATDYPASRVAPENGELIWMLDQAAAGYPATS